MSEHINTSRKLRDIPLIKDFNDVLNLCTLSDEDKEILRRHYIKKQTFALIGDELGYSERTIKEKHQKALRKISHAL